MIRFLQACLLCGAMVGLLPGPTLGAEMTLDLKPSATPLVPVWNYFGYDEPNYTYAPAGKKLVNELTDLDPDPVYFRCHSLLSTGDGTAALKWGSTNAYTEDAAGNPVYDWTIVDRIFDTYHDAGGRPYVQIGFMPEALSIHPDPYQHHWNPGGKAPLDTGWAYPPKDYTKWRELCRQWTLHEIQRYGEMQVRTWYWEVWNEPNILYWHGTPEEYQKLYDFAVAGVRDALPSARVGGSEVAGMGGAKAVAFQRKFFEHCLRGTNFATGKTGSPIDFISFHAKGSPRVIDGHVRMGIASQLHDIATGFDLVSQFPELKTKPIVIGESDPDGCAACPSSIYPQNGYRNGTLYSAYTAASIAREFELQDRSGVNFAGALTWAFEFEDQPAFAGFRVLSTDRIDLPVLNLFRLLGQMHGQRQSIKSGSAVAIDEMIHHGVVGRPDINALASVDDHHAQILIWNYSDDDLPGPVEKIDLQLLNFPKNILAAKATVQRIDEVHGNAFNRWKEMGSPARPSPAQLADLQAAAKLVEAPLDGAAIDQHDDQFHLAVPRQGVLLLKLAWE